MNKSERLRPAIVKLGKRLNSNEQFFNIIKSDFLAVLNRSEELEIEMPNLVSVYVSEFFSSDDKMLLEKNNVVLGRINLSVEEQKWRNDYQSKPQLQYNIDSFKKTLRKIFKMELAKQASCVEFVNKPSTLETMECVQEDPPNKDDGQLNDEHVRKESLRSANTTVVVPPVAFEKHDDAVPDGGDNITRKPKKKSKKRKKRSSEPVAPAPLPPSIIWFQQNLTVVKMIHRAYVDGKLGFYRWNVILKFFEETGFTAFSMVDNVRRLTSAEAEVMQVFESIRLKFNKELLTNGNRRVINQPNGGQLCDEFTSLDDLRRAISITFGPAVHALGIIIDYLVQQVIHIGMIHPSSKAGNALGNHGIELLFKGPGLEEQVPHFDFPCFKDTNQFLSYDHSKKNKLKFDPKLDGGVSLFVNHTGKTDYLNGPDGLPFILPPYSFCILRGNVAHCGTGNSTDDAIFKYFCYIDPVEYDRANNEYRDSVFLFDEFRQVVRAVAKPCTVKLVAKTLPYLCVYCFGTFHYTNPFCMDCMRKHWKVVLTCTADNHFVYTYSGKPLLKKGYQFPDAVVNGFIDKAEYHRKYSAYFGNEVIGCIPVSNSHFLSFLEHKSFLATMKKSLTDYNVELLVSGLTANSLQGVLRLTSDVLRAGGELVLRADPRDQNNGVLMVDPDDYAVKHVKEDAQADGSTVTKGMKSGALDRDLCIALQKQCLDDVDDEDDSVELTDEGDDEEVEV